MRKAKGQSKERNEVKKKAKRNKKEFLKMGRRQLRGNES